eukprot:TRINITY_DN4728_c0_g1_i1.p1 TRINITY_DN4728_c0_g1~~TRINITY_DN4728_c0_g1_i1.p1  ORF type:complete len:173 (+),score=38.62 TRINITY_DN4728_c0_g1_i1:118-636(+)
MWYETSTGIPLNGGFVDLGSLPFFSDFNLYFAEGATYTFNFQPFDEWQDETGLEVNSITGQDPLFTDPENDAYTISDDSPAIQIGFHDFVAGHDETVGRTQSAVLPDIIAEGIDRPAPVSSVLIAVLGTIAALFTVSVLYRCAKFKSLSKAHYSGIERHDTIEHEMSTYVSA